jgi:xanthine dehydrogenase YagS FAD-binding subunit
MIAELRAGATDLSERRRSGISRGPIVDIGPRPDLVGVAATAAPAGGVGGAGAAAVGGAAAGGGGGLDIGALTPIATVAADPRVRSGYPGLAAAAGGLATPQVRRIGTVGGNLLQRTRCWYYRNPGVDCLKKGGTACPARAGNHRLHVVFDLGPCVAPHPSTLGAAMLAYDGSVVTDRRSLTVADLYGNGSDGTRDHLLEPGELLTHLRLPASLPGERAAYFRAISRTYAEWPLVEAVVRLGYADGVIAFAAIAVGGVAPVPIRLPGVERLLVGQPVEGGLPADGVLRSAAGVAAAGANPLPQTGYKRALLVGTVYETLRRAAALG